VSPRLRRPLAAFALLLPSSALALVVAEGLVRRFAPQSVRVAWEDERDGIRVPRPGVRGRHAVPGKFDVRVSINGQRFRASREFAASAAPGVKRLAVLGDSMTFGWGAEDGQTYPAQLESILSALPPETSAGISSAPSPETAAGAGQLVAVAVEVINAGYPGACLGEKAAWYVQGVRPFRPSLVVLTLLGDDVDGDLFWRVFALDSAGRAVLNPPSRRGGAAKAARSTRSVFQAMPGYALLAERSELFALLRTAATRAASRERTTALGQRPSTPSEVATFRQEGLALLSAELRWLRDRTREDGAALAVVLVPFRESVYPDRGWWADELRWKTAAVAEAAAATCREMDTPFRDLTPALIDRARATAAPLYHEGIETHPTPAGYRAIAEEVATFLLERGLVGGRTRSDGSWQ
jgi:lysophospholipase L1-like esterase